jgi:hypothetical protein
VAINKGHPKPLKRRVETRPELRTFLVFCEGDRTEPDYLNGLKNLPEVRRHAAVRIEIDTGHGVPLTLVRLAVDRKTRDNLKRSSAVDEYWCAFDVEWPKNHPNLDQAVKLAHRHDIHLAISNPCFEIWLLLHFKNRTRWTDTDKADAESRKLDGRAGKRIDASVYLPNRATAARRAAVLAAMHEKNENRFPHDNPSSTMFALLDALGAEARGEEQANETPPASPARRRTAGTHQRGRASM